MTVVADTITNSGTCTIEGVLFDTAGVPVVFTVVRSSGVHVWSNSNTAGVMTNTGISANDLTIDSTNAIKFEIGGVPILAIDDAAISGFTAAIGGVAGKSLFVATQDGSASDAGFAGANFTLSAGAGASATNPGDNGGDSGCLSFVVQSGGGAGGGGTVGNDGVLRLNGLTVFKQGAPAAKTTTTTLDPTELTGNTVTGTHSAGATQAYVLPTGALMDAAIHSEVGNNEGFYWSLINLFSGASNTIRLTASTAHTIVGGAVIAAGDSGLFFTRKTTTNTFVTSRRS